VTNAKPKSFDELSPAEHLVQAETFRRAISLSDLAEPRKHLKAIPATAGESKQARVLAVQIDKLEQGLRQIEIDKAPLEIVRSDWSKKAFDTVAMWKVTFRNRSKRPV